MNTADTDNQVYLVHYTTFSGEDVTSELIRSYEDLQLYMNDLLGMTFTAKVGRFTNQKLDGYKYVKAGMNQWEDISEETFKEITGGFA